VAGEPTYFKQPGLFTRIFNGLVAAITRLGIGPAGARSLTVVGRKSGKPFTTPVNPLDLDGQTYLVSPRGNTQWSRNLRAVGEGELRLGRKVRRFRGEEVADADKLPILKAYLDKWAWEVGAFFELPKDPTDEQIAERAPKHPVFRVSFSD
jgi:deazaflavin-dependent oxidoreductase (nitroreductase family)